MILCQVLNLLTLVRLNDLLFSSRSTTQFSITVKYFENTFKIPEFWIIEMQYIHIYLL